MGWPELIDKDKTELRDSLVRLGAVFGYDTLGGCYNYSSNWLNEARELDQAWRRLALLRQHRRNKTRPRLPAESWGLP